MLTKKDYFKAKKSGATSRPRKTLKVLDNGRSADYIIPNFATSCELYCAFCYVSRNQPFGNPLISYTNIDEIIEATRNHFIKLPPKIPNQCDNQYYTYDIGESSDCLNPSLITNTNRIITGLVSFGAKPTFATKLGHPKNIAQLVNVPANTARVRMSVAPEYLIKKLEIGSSKLKDRLAGIDIALDKGYEVHLNFSPVVVYASWLKDYAELMQFIDSKLSIRAKKQIKAEVIFLTHSAALHKETLTWNPEAEDLLWSPQNQEPKVNLRGQNLIRYKYNSKQYYISQFKMLLSAKMLYCPIRYIF